jgi:endonuclease-3
MVTGSKSRLLTLLSALYPDPKSELCFTNTYQLIVSVILSAQCTDKKVNEVTPTLFSKFRAFSELAKATLSEVEGILRPINYYRTKSKNIIEMARMVCSDYNGELPDTMEDLITLPGVGRKTANVVLGEREITPSLAVDTHVFRVSRRLGLSRGETPDDVERSLKRSFPPSSWRNLHHQLIFHGRRVCKARKPLCGECALFELCPSREKTASIKLAENQRRK